MNLLLELKIGTVVTSALRNFHANFFLYAFCFRLLSPYGPDGQTDARMGKTRNVAY